MFECTGQSCKRHGVGSGVPADESEVDEGLERGVATSGEEASNADSKDMLVFAPYTEVSQSAECQKGRKSWAC